MKKGCLTGIIIFFALSMLLAMCSSDSESEGSNALTTVTESSSTATSIIATFPPHDHTFDDPTCIAPKTCSICGITEGEKAEHTWVEATCLSPKTCSVCNAKEGKPLEHNWSEATCTKKKTCLDCGETTGTFASHQYSNGKCTVCSNPDPSDPRNITVWVPTNGGTKYHSRSSCSGMKNPRQTTLAQAKAEGYGACSKCH